MILDTLKHAERYEGLHPRFREAFAFLKVATGASYPVGTYELDGRDLYASVQEYETKPVEAGVFEAHERYIDIQYLLSGVERMDVADLAGTVPKAPYDGERDVVFLEDPDRVSTLAVPAGSFAVFFPSDAHKPGLSADGAPLGVRKIVVKIRV